MKRLWRGSPESPSTIFALESGRAVFAVVKSVSFDDDPKKLGQRAINSASWRLTSFTQFVVT